MTQLDGLTDWFSRLYGAEAGARMENGLEKTVVEYGHDPTIKERFNRRLDCSPQHWLSANRLMPKNLLENGLPWLAYMEKHPDADKDAAWDLIARDRLEDKRRRGVRNLTPTPLSDGSSSRGNRPYGYNGRKRFERLLAEGRAEWEPALPLDAAGDVRSTDTGFEDMVLTGIDRGLAYLF